MKLSIKEREIIERVDRKLRNCLDYYMAHPEEGYNNILRLIFAEKIRATKHIRPISPTKAKNDDERAVLVEKVTAMQAERMIHNIQVEQKNLENILLSLGGKHRENDPLKPSHFRLKGVRTKK